MLETTHQSHPVRAGGKGAHWQKYARKTAFRKRSPPPAAHFPHIATYTHSTGYWRISTQLHNTVASFTIKAVYDQAFNGACYFWKIKDKNPSGTSPDGNQLLLWLMSTFSEEFHWNLFIHELICSERWTDTNAGCHITSLAEVITIITFSSARTLTWNVRGRMTLDNVDLFRTVSLCNHIVLDDLRRWMLFMDLCVINERNGNPITAAQITREWDRVSQ